MPEEIFDNITKIASQICGTPIALISLVDENRQWFKSRHGLLAQETPRDISFCGHAILQNESVFEIPNSLEDPRFSDNPLVTGDPRVVFYAGAPLRTPTGEQIGTLCVIDHVARKLTLEQNIALRALADTVVTLFETKRIAAISAYNERLLKTERSKTDALIAESPSAIALMRGPDLVFEIVNKKWTELVSPREYVGRKFIDVYPELVGSAAHMSHLDIFATGKSFIAHEMKLLVTSPSGVLEDQYFDYTNFRLNDSEGNPYGVYCSALNVTERVKQRIAFEANSQSLSETLESMNDGFFSVDKDFIITHVNQVMEKTTGLSRDQMIGKSHLDLFFSGAQERETLNWREYHRVMKDRVPASYVDYYAPLDNWTRVNLYPKPDGGMAVFFTDITETREAEILLKKTEESFRAITEATPLIVWTATPSGEVDYANSKWYEFSGLSPEQTRGTGFTSIIHPDDVKATMQAFGESLASLQPLEIEHRFKRKSDNSYRWFLTRAVATIGDDGKATKWFGTNVDIHDQKQAALELKDAKADAERANSAKSSFLANMSHEIRSPLGAIMGFSDLLKTQNLSKDELLGFVSVIDRNSNHLLRVIDDILDLSKVEAGKLAIEHIDFSLPDLLADFSSLMGFRAREKGIEFDLRIPTLIPDLINSDPTRLRQILNNVVGNAMKFTERGRVQMTVKYLDGTLEFLVSDTGTGISKENAEKLFQPFEQGDASTTRKFGGTGLGLVLTRMLTEALGGSFTLQSSNLGRGSVFAAAIKVDLPGSAKLIETKDLGFVARTTPIPFSNGRPLEGMKILVVEDSPDNQVLFKLVLSKVGAQVEIAPDGYHGVNLALTNDYDVVLMDVQMPRMDGHEATRALREKGYLTPVIALTAHAMIEERARAEKSGFTDFLSKPVHRDALIDMLVKFKRQ